MLLLREILCNISIAIVCYPGYNVINFEINLIFLIKPFFLYLENKKSFQDEINAFFIIFKRLSSKQIKQVFLKGQIQEATTGGVL